MYRIDYLTQTGKKAKLFFPNEDMTNQAKRQLLEKKILVRKISQTSAAKKKPSYHQLRHIMNLLKLSAESKVPIENLLKMEIHESQDKELKEFFISLSTSLFAGYSLRESLSQSTFEIPLLYLNLIQAGESSGGLEQALEEIKLYMFEKRNISQEILKATLYPAMVSALSMVVFLFLTKTVLPNFNALYESFNQELPPITKITLQIVQWFNTYFVWITSSSLALIFALYGSLKFPSIQAKLLLTALKIPTLSTWVSDAFIYGFINVIELQLSRGIPLVEAIALASQSFKNLIYVNWVKGVKKNVENGLSFSESLAGPFYLLRFKEYLMLGEASGNMRAYLQDCKRDYRERIHQRLFFLKETLQPALIILIGLMITFILVILFLPIFSITDFVGY